MEVNQNLSFNDQISETTMK